MKRENFFFNFFVFLFLALLVLGLSKTVFVVQTSSFFASILRPFEQTIFGIFNTSAKSNEVKKLEEENQLLTKKLIDQDSLKKDLQALKDQFQTMHPQSKNLLFAHIVGAPRFIPSITFPETFILNKGKNDGVHIGQAVVVKDSIIGEVVEVSENLSRVGLVGNPSFSATAKILRQSLGQAGSSAIGVIKGRGNGEMILDNVVLSEELYIGDTVVTRGDIDIHGIGLPKDLIVGTITSIDKKQSALFQTAKVKSMVDFSHLSAVYIVIESED